MKEKCAFELDDIHSWPCLNCGSDDAIDFKVEKSGQVYWCTNCDLIKKDMHIQDKSCWCKPRHVGRDREGNDRWAHNDKH